MKRLLVVAVLVLTILMNVFSFLSINKNLVEHLLYDKTMITFDTVNGNKSVLEEDFLDNIIDFSSQNDVEILQYSFLSANKIDIYSTVKEEYEKKLLIPNFIFDKDIRIHDFEDVHHVGFKNLLYIDTKDSHIINKFLKDFSDYGVIYRNAYSLNSFGKYIKYIDNDFLSIFSLFISVFFLLILFYYLNNKKNYLIYELWGYSYIQIYCVFNKTLYKTLLISMVFCNLIMLGILFVFNLTNMLMEFIPIIIIVNLLTVLLLFLFSIALFCISFVKSVGINEKNRLLKVRFVASLVKFCLILLVIILFGSFYSTRNVLKNNQDSLDLWKDTTNLFYVETTGSIHDLALESKDNDKLLQVYKDLSRLNKVFIINSINFQRLENLNTDNEEIDYDYNYKLNVKNDEDLYTPRGRRIMVDGNYLKRNLIKTFSDGKNVLDKINYDDDVLNVLVPEKFKDYEDIIEKSYKEWFYFQKVEVSNMYRKALNENLNEKETDDLKINLIYIENNQYYFTYNKFAGDNFNRVKDPIVIVYTENVDNSVLAATLGSSMFLESKDEYSALGELKDITNKYSAYELNWVSSVYDRMGAYIGYIEDEIDRLVLNISVASLILMILMIIITWAYYKAYISKIVIKSLYGYNFITTYKDLLLSNLFIYIFSVLIMMIIYRKLYLYMIIFPVLMLLIDYIVSKAVNMALLKKGEVEFIKGESK
ncbi:hypothetical protein SAMN05446037_10644 [Anaerovirgula multivorans]|uniref:Bacteriocin-associated integral membrane (Putative immunity) protein n=1 Tax=Anaerovirgula multivorans TaxID=312168 RepID=A0A239L5X3_9FIRM|nr:DUF1430 domain-containing protein [Anaerovirgula multivorans]SNT25725.1 hypothetical protein SAMN05446037_10644 [Anaerovirgula multivorans]